MTCTRTNTDPVSLHKEKWRTRPGSAVHAKLRCRSRRILGRFFLVGLVAALVPAWAPLAGADAAIHASPAAAAAAGDDWAIQSSPTPAGAISPTLAGVSCVSASDCVAVGYYSNGSGNVTLAEDWNGTTWSIQTTPSPAGSVDSVLVRVSCVSTSDCVAVGFGASATTVVPLVERWNGTAWSIESVPAPGGTTGSFLYGISCLSASDCVAVGDYSKGSATLTLVEGWNGTKWSLQRSHNPSGNDAVLGSVSCVSATVCTAVGDSAGGAKPLAERWNGTAWSIQTTPASGGFAAVSCPSASLCTAVGYTDVDGLTKPLAERWNRTAWSVQSTPQPVPQGSLTAPQSEWVQLLGVSCPSTGACIAVGIDQTQAGGTIPLVESWTAAGWTIQDSPQAIGASSSQLTAVSCSGVGVCTTTGTTNLGEAGQTFVEHAAPGICAVDDAACSPSGVFVSPNGNDAWAGTRTQPKLTLAAAVAVAAQDHTNVYAMVGIYDETLEPVNGDSVYGGYNGSWALSSTQNTVITGALDSQGDTISVLARGITKPTTLERLVLGSDNAVAGSGSYGLSGVDDPGLRLMQIGAYPAPGSSGLAGYLGYPGFAGAGGGSGQSGLDSGGGGYGGANPGGDGAGGAGGDGATDAPEGYGGPGLPGLPGDGSSSAACGEESGAGGLGGSSTPTAGTNGAPGEPGCIGADGTGGGGGNTQLGTGLWFSQPGTPGANGLDGTGGGGGGGGGAAGGFFSTSTTTGGGGGGGGNGGGGGAGGGGGQPGGGSFGIFLSDSAGAIVQDSIVVSANGGAGGPGGAGGAGGAGGSLGFGGSPYNNAGEGGGGGPGGNGGWGGGGGGGAGGPSIAVAGLTAAGAPASLVTDGAGGTGGAGGPAGGGGGSGTAGANGSAEDFLSPPV